MHNEFEVGFNDQPDLTTTSVDLNQGADLTIIPSYMFAPHDHRTLTAEEIKIRDNMLAARNQLILYS